MQLDSNQRMLDSLEGLSVGDAFGQQFFMTWEMSIRLMESGEFGGPPFDFQDEFIARELIGKRDLRFAEPIWKWTDDTAMALSVVANLWTFESIKPDDLARAFSRRYARNPNRVYGAAMHDLLPKLASGDTENEAAQLFDGMGSWGNGAAMRAAPIGAFFADDIDAATANAKLSARVTHAHPEAVVGAVAVALAAAFAARGETDLLGLVIPRLPESEVKKRCRIALEMTDANSIEVAAKVGSGDGIAAHDTVPFCLWCATQFVDSFEEALWHTVAGLGDRDTTCAIVGGIVGARVGVAGIPAQWRERRESLEAN